MFRLSALFPVLLSIAAFILSVLVLLAGKDTNFLPDVFVLKVDTSQIATTVDAATILRSAGIDPNNTGLAVLDNAIAKLTSAEVSAILNTAAHELGLHDFYTAHVSTWCEGMLISKNNDSSTTNSSNALERTTQCTTPKFPFSFDPIKILEAELLQGLTLDQLGFPTNDIDAVVKTLQTAYKGMSICYLIGCILSGVLVLTGLLGFRASRAVEALNEVIALLALLALGIGSAAATAVAVKVRDVFNQRAGVINVHAVSSVTFLGMTWAAVAALLLVSLSWCCVCCCASHSRRRPEKRMAPPVYGEKMKEPRAWTSWLERRNH